MNSLATVLTQKIANDFLDDREVVALGRTAHNQLRILVGSQYRIKGRVDYQVVPDRPAGCARLCEMTRIFTEHHYFCENNGNEEEEEGVTEYRTLARSQPIAFSHEKRDRYKVIQDDADISSRPPPIALTFTRVDHGPAGILNDRYRIGCAVHIRLARSEDPRLRMTELGWENRWEAWDSDDEFLEYEMYDHERDDGRIGRPELTHLDFLPSSMRQLHISKTILLSPHVTMSALHRVESLTLGALWPWQLTPPKATSYWPPQVKRLKFKRCLRGYDESRFFGTINISTTFPSTLTELELPEKMYELFAEEESEQLSAIQYPAGLVKLIHPFNRHTFGGWRLPSSLTYLECDLDPELTDQDVSWLIIPPSVRTLGFSTVYHIVTPDLSLLRLPASLTEINYPRDGITPPLDLSHTSLISFTVQQPFLRPLSSYQLPGSVTRIDFGPSEFVPRLTPSYVWPSKIREVKLEINRYHKIDAKDVSLPPHFHLPPTLRRLIIYSDHGSDLASLVLHEGIESLHIHSYIWSSLVLPSTLTDFNLSCNSFTSNQSVTMRLPSFGHTQLTTLDLSGWSRPLTREEFVLPETLRSLQFGSDFDHPLDELRLPPGLNELRFGSRFNQSFTPLVSQLPQQLRVFTLGRSFTQLSSLMDLRFPSTMRKVDIPSPSSGGILLSPFHTRYTDFVSKLEQRVGCTVDLFTSNEATECFV